jgi:hypothetical protein
MLAERTARWLWLHREAEEAGDTGTEDLWGENSVTPIEVGRDGGDPGVGVVAVETLYPLSISLVRRGDEAVQNGHVS